MAISIITAIATAVVGAIGGAGAATAFGAFLAGTAGKIIMGVIGTAISMGLSMLTAKKPKAAAPFVRQAVDRMQTVRSSVEPHRVIYGKTRVSGPITYATSSGGGNTYWHMIIPVAGHEVAEIGDIWINNDVIPSADINASGTVTAGKYANNVRIKRYVGRDDQTADADLVAEAPSSEWTSNERGRGIAYVYARLAYSPDLFPNGLPNVTAIVKGRKVYDPRNGTTTWSDNPALCILDYMRSEEFGLGIEDDEWDASWWSAQANLCDESVQYETGLYQKRYTCNGSITLDAKPLDIIDDLMTSCIGAMIYQEGKYKLHAAQYVVPDVTLTASDLRGPVEVVTRPHRRDLFNAVRGTFVDPNGLYQPTDFPAVTNATYETQDNGERIYRDVELPFTQNVIEAQRIGKIVLERHRQGITIRWPGKYTVLKVSAWGTVSVTLSEFGWTNKVFRVLSFELDESTGCPDLFLQEEASTSYDWALGAATTYDSAPDTGFASPFDPPSAPSGLALYSGDAELDVRVDGTVFSRLRVAWTLPALVFVQLGGRTQIEYKESSSSDWLPGPYVPGSADEALILDVADGSQYDVRVRHLTSVGVPSAWATQTSYTVLGKSAKPSAPSLLLVSQTPDGSRKFEWVHTSVPADVRAAGGYRIKYALSPEQDWADMTLLHEGVLKSSPYETVDLPAGTYNFAIVAVDSSGNESTTPTKALSVVLTDPPMAGAVYYADERAGGWAGTKTGCFVDTDGSLQANGSLTWAGLTNAWSTYTGDWFFGGSRTSPITYETATIDLGAQVLAKPIISPVGSGTITVEQKAWTTGGEPGAYSATGQATARYWKFKVTVTGSTPYLTSLPIILDAPSVSDLFSDINTSTETNNSVYFYRAGAGDVYFAPRNGITVISVARINALQAVAGAWTWELVSKNATPPVGWNNLPGGVPCVQFKIRNATPALADAIIDVELRGPRA